MSEKEAVLEPPRWRNGPAICSVSNLPAFATEADAASFREVNAPHFVVLAQWRCKFCGCWHYWGNKYFPKRINEMIWKTKVAHEV